MKIISFTMVNNESEIIESFVRYNYNFVDEMVIIDNGCTDSTIKILRNMISEGYKIKIFDESLEAYNQYRLDNKYLNKIIDELEPDLILPLDADEFVISDGNPREMMEKLDLNKIHYVNWQWYVLTENDNTDELFIPKKLNYRLRKTVWNYSDQTPVTKVIIPAQYYKKLHLTLSMGHHTVFGNNKVEINNISNIRFAHYRAISEDQLIYKTSCYTMRDIATMENNSETAQRTNQMHLIENGNDMWEAAVTSSYAGYPRDIVNDPIELKYCDKESLNIKYGSLAKESISTRILRTGQEMAIRAYNVERSIKEKKFLKPVVFWLDGVRKTDVVMPLPSNHLTILTAKYNIRAYVTMYDEIKFLKVNYRLIVTPEQVKFIPHSYIVVPDTVEINEVKKLLSENNFNLDNVITLSEYKSKLGIAGRIYSNIAMIPALVERVRQYIKRNGINTTVKKIKERIGK